MVLHPLHIDKSLWRADNQSSAVCDYSWRGFIFKICSKCHNDICDNDLCRRYAVAKFLKIHRHINSSAPSAAYMRQ